MNSITNTHWHSVCLVVYLVIVLADFLIFPIVTESFNHAVSPREMITLATQFDASAQIAALQLMHEERVWQPITLGMSGMFHVAFGAILGIGAWARTKR